MRNLNLFIQFYLKPEQIRKQILKYWRGDIKSYLCSIEIYIMKKTLFILMAFFAFSTVNAQTSFMWLPNDTIVQDIDPNAYNELLIEQKNLTGDTLNLGVEIVLNTIDLTWDGMVCLQGICFGTIPLAGATNQMAPLVGSLNGYVKLTVNPLGGFGSGTLRVRVYDMNNPSDGDTCTWIVNSLNTTSVEDKDASTVLIYPNPATDLISVVSSSLFNNIAVFDIQGKKVLNTIFKNTTETSVNVSVLKSGVYFVKTYTDGVLMETQKFTISE